MRVLFLNRRLSDRGGADRWLLGVLARLQGRAETQLLVGYADQELPAAERERIGPWERLKGLDRGGLGRPAGPAARARLAEAIERFAPDAIHVNDVMDPELLEIAAATGRAVAMVQDHRCFCPGRGKVDADDRACNEPMGERCLRCFEDEDYGRTVLDLTQRRLDAVSRMGRVTVLSRYMAGELAAAGVAADRIEVVPPFVDRLACTADGDPGAGEHHLLVGRLSRHKGIAVALAAARAMDARLPLTIAGEGPLADKIKRAALDPDGQVRFQGWADRETLAVLLGQACSLWLPSLWAEPFGIVGLEAMAAGVPVVAADVGGVRDWLEPDETGLLIAANDPAGLAAAADRLAADQALARRLGERGRQRLEQSFDPEGVVQRLLELYAEMP